MIFSAVIAGDDIKAQLKPFSVYENIEWHDVTQKAIENWKKTRIASFEEFLQGFHTEWEELPPTHWQGIPIRNQVGYIKKDGEIRVMYFGNINGWWSSCERPGKEYQDFFLLRDGSRNWRAEAGLVDLESDIRSAIEVFTDRWRYVRKEISENKNLPPYGDIMQSDASRLDMDSYVEKRVCQYVAPEIFIMDGECHNFAENPSWKTLEKYKNLIRDLARTSPHMILTCLGLHT